MHTEPWPRWPSKPPPRSALRPAGPSAWPVNAAVHGPGYIIVAAVQLAITRQGRCAGIPASLKAAASASRGCLSRGRSSPSGQVRAPTVCLRTQPPCNCAPQLSMTGAGMAVKVLVDGGKPSLNFVAMHSRDGQGERAAASRPRCATMQSLAYCGCMAITNKALLLSRDDRHQLLPLPLLKQSAAASELRSTGERHGMWSPMAL